jgi:hypothetical protein
MSEGASYDARLTVSLAIVQALRFIALLIVPALQLQVITPCNGTAARKTNNGGN